jgi:hypothetical protein
MDILTLREELETLLVDHLGEYKLANGETTTAVHVRAVGEAMPAGTTVSGIELILVREPSLDPIRQYSNPKALRRWEMFLVGWAPDDSLEEAASLIVDAYPSATLTAVTVPESVGPQNQLRIVLTTAPPAET